MLYNTPRSLNPLIGPRSFGGISKPKSFRRHLGYLPASNWLILNTAGRSPVYVLQSPAGAQIPLSTLGVDATWSVFGPGTPTGVTLVAPDGTRKTFSFRILPGLHGTAGGLQVLESQTQRPPAPMPAGFSPIGVKSDLDAFLVRLVGVNQSVVPVRGAGDLWAFKGEVTFSDPHVDYIGKRYSLLDRSTGETFIVDVKEHSGTYSALGAAAQAVSRAIGPVANPLFTVLTDLGTGGVSELVGVVDHKVQKQMEDVVGGSSVGGAAGVVTGYVGSGFNPVGAIAGGVAGAVSGTVSGVEGAAQDKAARDIVGNAIIGGAVSGAAAGVTTALVTAATPAPQASGSYEMGPVTLTPDTAGSTLLPSSLSLVPSTPPPPVFGLPPVGAPLFADYSTPPLEHLPLPPVPQNAAGSTLLPPNLSVTPAAGGADLGIVAPPGIPGGLLSDIVAAGKVGIPGAISGYQIYKKLTTPASGLPDGGNTLIFGADPSLSGAPVAAPKSNTLPILAGVGLFLALALKTRH